MTEDNSPASGESPMPKPVASLPDRNIPDANPRQVLLNWLIVALGCGAIAAAGWFLPF